MIRTGEAAVALRRVRSMCDPMFAQAMLLYGQSFPAHELRLWGDQVWAMGDEAFMPMLAVQGGEFAGLCFCWNFGELLYVEHLSVDVELRGRGIGRQILEALAQLGKTVVLEIDPPADAVSIRRKGFYERCGYVENPFAHVHPPYRAGREGHALVVMSYPRALTQEAFDAFASSLRDRAMRYSQPRRIG